MLHKLRPKNTDLTSADQHHKLFKIIKAQEELQSSRKLLNKSMLLTMDMETLLVSTRDIETSEILLSQTLKISKLFKLQFQIQ
jgi:hypothetical protein